MARRIRRARVAALIAVCAMGMGVSLFARVSVGSAESASASVTVNGAPMHGDGSRRLDGCTLDVAVSGLSDGGHVVHLVVAGAPPSGRATLIDETASGAERGWNSGPRDMTEAIAASGLQKKANGFHLSISLAVDGERPVSALFWLACGAQQHSGHSWSVPLSVRWVDAEGHDAERPSAPTFFVDATSNQAEAHCVYANDATPIECTYTKTSHAAARAESTTGDDEEGPMTGVWVSGVGSYSVVVSGVPNGWTVEASTVGTFTPRVECPEPPDAPLAGRTDCPHEVLLRSITASTTTVTVEGEGTTNASVVPGSVTSTTSTSGLPYTGNSTSGLTTVGLIAAGIGAVLVRTARRRSLAVEPRHR